jgi:flagellar protein FlaI
MNETIDDISKNLDTLEKIEEATLQNREFENAVSKYYGVEIKSETVSEATFTNLRVVDSYPITDYSYISENGKMEHLVQVYILQNKRTNEYIYYVDEPKLNPVRSGLDDTVDEAAGVVELKWYNRIKSDFDEIISNLDKSDFDVSSQYIDGTDRDDIDYVIDKIEKQEYGLSLFRNKIIDVLYDSVLEGVAEDIDSLPEKSKVKYETIPSRTKKKIKYFLQLEYIEYGKISPMINDPYIEEISCNAPNDPVKVYHSEYDQHIISNKAYDSDELRDTINMLANISGEELNTANPQADGSLPDGSRINLVIGQEESGVGVRGHNFTIRVFDEVPLTPIDLLNYDTMSVEQMVWLWLSVQFGKSGIIAGGTASGKTTTLNSLSAFTEPSNKIVTIEDTQELVLNSDNYIQGITRQSLSSDSSYNIDMMSLVKASLRQRPDYLIIGEVRGEEARQMFQAMSTGHTSYATFHASDISELRNRLTGDPINVGLPMLESLDFVITQIKLNDSGRRVVNELQEVKGVESEEEAIVSDLITNFEFETRDFTGIKWLESEIIKDIRVSNAWSVDELKKEIEDRTELLEYMADNMPRENEHDFEAQKERSKKINKIIKLYMRNKDMAQYLMKTDLMLKDDLDKYMDMLIGSQNASNLSQVIQHTSELKLATEHANNLHQVIDIDAVTNQIQGEDTNTPELESGDEP